MAAHLGGWTISSVDDTPFTALFQVKVGPSEKRSPALDVVAEAGRIFGYRSSGHRDKVLILAQRDDKHADAVATHLFANGTGVFRFDIESYPASGTLSLRLGDRPGEPERGALRADIGALPLQDVRSVWLRPDLSEVFGLDPPGTPIAAFIRRESQSAFDGLAALLDTAFWVNRPAGLHAAASKVAQLKVAGELGLVIPRTLVTNDPDLAREFVRECGGDVVVKAFRGMIGPQDDPSLVFTSRLLPERLAQLHLVRNAPCVFQERVPNASDLRVTVIGRRLFPVEIGFRPDHEQDADWRKVERDDTAYRAVELPDDVHAGCVRLMDHFGLACASIDLIRRPDGQHVFLEVNPQVNWLWLEVRTGLPIARAMADLLARGSLD